MKKIYKLSINIITAMIIILIIAVSIFFWPIPYLGFDVDPTSARINNVEIETSADKSGLKLDDKIIQIYGLPWKEVTLHINRLSLIESRQSHIPITIQRNNKIYYLELSQEYPSFELQLAKVINLFLAVLCWIIGYIFGLKRQQETSGSILISLFWLGMSLLLIGYSFSFYSSYILSFSLQWLFTTMLFPLSFSIHSWYPVRQRIYDFEKLIRKILSLSFFVLNVLFLCVFLLFDFDIIRFVIFFHQIMPLFMILSFSGGALFLYGIYKNILIGHVHRQIRIIAISCFFVGAFWFLNYFLSLYFGDDYIISYQWMKVVTILVPVSYITGVIAEDLYVIDRIAVRSSLHISVIIILVVLLVLLMENIGFYGVPMILWVSVGFVVLYNPLYSIVLKISPIYKNDIKYYYIHESIDKLTLTLDISVVVDNICNGIRLAFNNPPLGFYMNNYGESGNMCLIAQKNFIDIPDILKMDKIIDYLSDTPGIIENRKIYDDVSDFILNEDERRIIYYSRVIIWCPIYHSEGYILGLLLLGTKGDLDPYRKSDIYEIQKLINAASLSLTNSIAYNSQREAKQTIQELYRRLRQERDTTASIIARELHDEIINVNVRLNTQSLEKMLADTTDLSIKSEIKLILESEYAMAQALRMVCERLHPIGIDDPLGLPVVLRRQIEKFKLVWFGNCNLYIETNNHPIETNIQIEVFYLLREALNNIVKHANATEVNIYLKYSDESKSFIQIMICDNGSSGNLIKIRQGHRGIVNMKEIALSVGGKVEFYRDSVKGTVVSLIFPASNAHN